MNRLLYFVSLIFATALSAVAQVRVEAALDSTDILIGSQVQLTVKVLANTPVTVSFPDLQPRDVLTKGVEVVRAEAVDTTSQMAETVELRRTYVLTSFDSARYVFLPPPVVVGGDTLQSRDTLFLNVHSVPVDTLHVEQFYGAKEVIGEGFTLKPKFVFANVFALFLIGLTVWLWRKVRRLRPRVVLREVVPPPTPDQIALQQVPVIASDKDSYRDEAQRYDALVKVLRTYIQARYGIDGREMTSRQLLDTLQKYRYTKGLSSLRECLVLADYVRFSGQDVHTAPVGNAFAFAQEFVETTREAPATVEPIIKEEIESDAAFAKRRRRWLTAASFITSLTVTIAVWLIYRWMSLL